MESKSPLDNRLRKNFVAIGVFVLIMATVLWMLSPGNMERRLARNLPPDDLEKNSRIRPGEPVEFRVDPLVDADYFPRLLADLTAARESIDVLMFEIKLGKLAANPANRLVQALVDAHQRGAAVHVRLEQSETDHANTRTNRHTAEYLSAQGINPAFDSLDVETHGKAVLIDGRILYVGNHNWSQASLTENKEVSLRVESPRVLSTLHRYFDRFDRRMKDIRQLSGRAVAGSEAWAADGVFDVAFLSNEEYLPVLRETIRRAKQRIDIQMYLIRPGLSDYNPVKTIFAELGDARKRGVQVSVLFDSHFAEDNSAAKEQLRREGVWDVRFDDENVTNHRKMVMIDDETVIVGSQNWSISALAASNETAVYVNNRRVAETLKKKLSAAPVNPHQHHHEYGNE